MTINNAKTAREFVRAWEGHRGALHMVASAAESQAVCARLSVRDSDRRGHLAAAAVLTKAARRLAEVKS